MVPSQGEKASMRGGRVFRAEVSDSTPWPWPISAPEPVLVCCPIPVSALSMSPAVATEIYRRAYEQAVSAARPSRLALASAVSLN